MKAIVLLSAMILVLACCKSKEKMMKSNSGNLTIEPVEMVVKEEISDTLAISVKQEDPREEEVRLTRGDEIMRYCVIVGSFMYEQNADNLRDRLIKKGFQGCSIMQNQQGMYRVSALCSNNLSAAQLRLADIRNRYPDFVDAWLLQVKE